MSWLGILHCLTRVTIIQSAVYVTYLFKSLLNQRCFSAVSVSKHKKRRLLPGAAADDVKRLEIYCKVACL